jgi:hypothetical protein
VRPLYPHKVTPQGKIEKYTCGEACCEVEPGYFCCCQSTKPDSSFRKLGLGICLYFKFLKHATFVLTLIVVIAVLATLLCIWIAGQNSTEITQDYNTFLFSTTLGVFAAEHAKCSYSKISNTANPLYPYYASADLNCPYGRVVYFGAVFSNDSSASAYHCRLENEKINSSLNLVSPYSNPVTESNNCTTSSSSCRVAMDLSSNDFSSSTVSFGFECVDQVYSLGNQLSSNTVFYLLVGADLAICLIFLLFFCSEASAEKEEVRFFKTQQLILSDFSLKMKGFTMSTYEEEVERILTEITTTLGTDALDQIVQIKTPDRIDFIEYQVKKEKVYKQLYDFINEEFFQQDINPSQFRNQDYFESSCYSVEKKYEAFKAKLTAYVVEYLKELYVPKQ